MKKFLTSFWFWGIMLVAFVTIILWDDDFEENAKGAYVKHKMTLQNVNFSQIENGFEHARMYAVECEMDDSQTNMDGTDIKMLFFKPDCATFTGRLIAASATKNPFEAKFSGDIRMWDTDNERMRTEEMRYLFNRKELTTQRPVTFWKDNAVLTGLGMTYNTETQEAVINQQVVIRLWEDKKPASAAAQIKTDKDPVSGLPIAEAPIEEIIKSQQEHAATDSAKVKEKEVADISSDTSKIKVAEKETEKSKKDEVVQTTAVIPQKESTTSTRTASDTFRAQASSTRLLRESQRPDNWQRMRNPDPQHPGRMLPPQPKDGENPRERKRPGMPFPRQNGENGNPANLFQRRERPSREEMEKRRAEREKMRRERMERSRNSRIGSAPARINSEKANTSQ